MLNKVSGNAWAAAIPAGLRALPQWVAHHNKKPEHPATGAVARVNAPASWGTFEDAKSAYERSMGDQASGVGFVLTETSGLVFVDFDHVHDERGVLRGDLDPEVRDLVLACVETTYTEVSPSGTGLHAIFIGKLPEGAGHRRQVGEAAVEVYDRLRYMTMTGNRVRYQGHPVALAAAPAVVNRVVEFVGTHDAAEPEAAEPERYEEVAEALTHLDPDMPRPEWLKVGMALKAGLGEAGRDLWVGWSRDGAKYQEGEPERLWDGFTKSGVGLGSIIWMAEQTGWSRDGKYREPEDVFTVVPGAPAADAPFSLLAAEDVECVPIHWLWKYRIARGHLALIAGDPKAGKTLMVESLAALRSRGRPLPEDEPTPENTKPRRWVLLESEDDENDTTAPRLKENGADMSRVTLLNRAGGRLMLTNPEHLKYLEAQLRELGDVEALVISPLHNFIGSSGKVDMNKDQDARTVLMPLVGLAKRLGIAVVAIHHMNKNSSAPALYRMLGSIGLVGVARTVLAVGRKDDMRYVALVGSNNRDAPTLGFDIKPSERDENIGVVEWARATFDAMDAEALLAPMENGGQRGARQAAAAAWLRTRLADGPVPSKVLFEEGKGAGFSQRTLERTRAEAGVEAARDGTKGWVWRLTPSTTPGP